MQLKDRVRVYDGDGKWFNEGRVTTIAAETVEVDFLDWIQRYPITHLTEHCEQGRLFWTSQSDGVRVKTYL